MKRLALVTVIAVAGCGGGNGVTPPTGPYADVLGALCDTLSRCPSLLDQYPIAYRNRGRPVDVTTEKSLVQTFPLTDDPDGPCVFATYAVPKSVKVYETNLHIYTSVTPTHSYALVGTGVNLPQDTYTYTYPSGYTLTVVATNTQFNGYQFLFTSSHNLPLAFLQIFGGPSTVGIGATATGIVGNQRQQPG